MPFEFSTERNDWIAGIIRMAESIWTFAETLWYSTKPAPRLLPNRSDKSRMVTDEYNAEKQLIKKELSYNI